MGFRCSFDMANRYDRPTMPAFVRRSTSSSGATVTAPVLVCSGRRIGTATARAVIEWMRSDGVLTVLLLDLSPMDLNLKGKRALVTGASKGIGRACVEMLEREGCVVLGVSRSIAPGPNAKSADLSVRGAAEEVAAAVAFLASERSAYTSGCILTIDGGAAARG